MPRSNQTKHLLAQSLQELMATTPLEKISSMISLTTQGWAATPSTTILRINTTW